MLRMRGNDSEGEGAWLPATAARVRGCVRCTYTDPPTQSFVLSERSACVVVFKGIAVAKCLEKHRKQVFAEKKQLFVTLFLQKQLFVQQKILSVSFSGVYTATEKSISSISAQNRHVK
jgi:hypothetical protein